MGINRKIKSDGEIHIDGTNVDIESTVDVTGDVNATGDVGGATSTITGDATVGGTLGVTGQATLGGIAYPTADGTADQVLTTDGSGTLSFATAASGGGGGTGIITDWQEYSPVATFNNLTSATINKAIYRRVGSNINIKVTINVTQNPTVSDITWEPANYLPSGLSVDLSLNTSGDSTEVIGSWATKDGSVPYSGVIIMVTNGRVAFINGPQGDFIDNNNPTGLSWTSGDEISLNFSVPISSWVTGTTSVNTGELPTICTINGLTSNESFAAGSDYTITNWSTPFKDTKSAWDSTNNKYVVPETGYYDVNFGITVVGDANLDMWRVMAFISLDGTVIRTGAHQDGDASNLPSGGISAVCNVTAVGYYMEAGAEITFLARQDNGNAETNDVYGDGTNTHRTYIDIAKRETVQTTVINAPETVSLFATMSSNQTISTNVTNKVELDGTTEDTINGFVPSTDSTTNNGYYLIPSTGYYFISAQVGTDNVVSNDILYCLVTKNTISTNDLLIRGSNRTGSHQSTDIEFTQASGVFKLNKDDKIFLCVDVYTDTAYDVLDTATVTDTFLNIHKLESGTTIYPEPIDIVASASDATNYTGTARFINITSTADVTFTNTSITDRIIYCSNNITVKFQVDNFINNIVKMSHASSTLQIESKYDGSDSGVSKPSLELNNCDIQCKNVLNLISGAQDPVGIGEEPLDLHITNCTINANQISLSTIATLDTDQRVYVESSNINCAIFQNTKDDDNTAFVKFGSKVVAQYVIGFFDVDNGGSIECLDGSNSQTVRIDIGSTTYLNSAYSLPFTANSNGIETSVVVVANTEAAQPIPNNAYTDIIYDDEEVDNTSSYDASTGIFTAKVKGFYAINARILFGSNSNFDTGDMVFIRVYKNTTLKMTGHINESVVTDNSNILYGSGVSGGVLLDVGDTLKAAGYQSCGIEKDLLDQGDDNYIQIYKIN